MENKKTPDNEKLCECENYECLVYGKDSMITVDKSKERIVQFAENSIKNCIRNSDEKSE